MNKKRFLFTSERALYPPFLKVIEILSEKYQYDCNVLFPEEFNDSPVWQHSDNLTHDIRSGRYKNINFISIPANKKNVSRYGFEKKKLYNTLKEIEPNYIFILSEFWEGITYQFLSYYRFKKNPKIISYVAINHIINNPLFSKSFPFIKRTRLKQLFAWGRLDGVVACATKSAECARRLELPESIPIIVNYLPVLGTDEVQIEEYKLPWEKENNFIIGYAGLLSEQKGWKYLVEAVLALPENYKLIIAGEGPQKKDLIELVKKNESKVHFAGLLNKEKLFGFYKELDLFVLPSITTSYSVEQMGVVLVEAMACGTPVIGSSSGAIPEINGDGGLIFAEKDKADLISKIREINENEDLRDKLVTKGLINYQKKFSCEVYAESIYNYLTSTV